MYNKLCLITLHCQGLTITNPFGNGTQAVIQALLRLGYVQIDTLSVIERAHHHTLWTRIPDYTPAYLSTLVCNRTIFEYWFHAASYLPMIHYRFVLLQMEAIKRRESPFYTYVDPKYMRYVLDKVRIDGPLKARDFKSSITSKSKWWNWSPTKQALEQLFMRGDLMIRERNGMEKVYDLRERVLPSTVNTSEPSLLEFAEYLITLAIQAYGFTTIKQLTHLRTGNTLRTALKAVLAKKIEEGDLAEYCIDGIPPIYASLDIFDTQLQNPDTCVRLLSPFDNAIIHRDRAQQLFAFDYALECYVTKEKRQFGYFCLPILYNERLVGRVDCKAHRKTGVLELVNLHIESTEINLDNFILHFAKIVQRFAIFNDCHSISISNVNPQNLTSVFRNSLSAI